MKQVSQALTGQTQAQIDSIYSKNPSAEKGGKQLDKALTTEMDTFGQTTANSFSAKIEGTAKALQEEIAVFKKVYETTSLSTTDKPLEGVSLPSATAPLKPS